MKLEFYSPTERYRKRGPHIFFAKYSGDQLDPAEHFHPFTIYAASGGMHVQYFQISL